MVHFFARRLMQTILVVWGISTMLFFLVRLSGDPAVLLAGPQATEEIIAAIRMQLGLDQPIVTQYMRFMGQLARLDFGDSYRFMEPAFSAVLERFPATLRLTLSSVGLAILVAFPIGLVSSLKRSPGVRLGVAFFSMMGQSVPAFVVGILLILVFSAQLKWFPSFGDKGAISLVLPTVTLAAFMMARQTRLISSYMLEVLREDFVRTARAKGLGPLQVYGKHAARNMLIPIVALLGVDLGQLMGGAVVTESVFAWPGIGRMMVEAVAGRDYPVIQASVFLISICVSAVNLLVDISYSLLDPRITFK